LLPHPDGRGNVVDHVVGVAKRVASRVVLVGEHPAYAYLDLSMLPDGREGVGPAGGLLALVDQATGGIAVALACDMPYIRTSLIESLVQGVQRGAPAMVPRRGPRLEPLCAAYRADAVRPYVLSSLDAGVRSMHRIVRAAGAREVTLQGQEAGWLDDWDAPEDVRREHRG